VLSHSKHYPSFKNLPSSQLKHDLSTSQVLQSLLHYNIQLVAEVLQVAHLVLSQDLQILLESK